MRRACYADFWKFAEHIRTDDIDGSGLISPYPVHLEFLHRIDDELMDNDVAFVEKSRRMIVTTHVCCRVLHAMLECDKRTGALFGTCYIAKNEEDGKKIIRRIRDIEKRLPWWLRRDWESEMKSELRVLDGGFCEAMHAGGDGPRGEGYSLGVLDEFAFQENGESNYRALVQSCRKVWAISTPNGKSNMFYRVVKEREIPNAHVVTLHYSEHPERRPVDGEDHYREALLKKMPLKHFLREHDLAYDVYVEPGHYSQEFRQEMVKSFEWDGEAIVTRGWDFGYWHPACVWSFLNEYGQWCRRKILIGHGKNTEVFAREVYERTQAWFPNATVRDACDPAVVQKRSLQSMLGAESDLHALKLVAKSMGLHVNPQFGRIVGKERRDGHRMVRNGLIIREDGLFASLFHPDCSVLIDGFKGGYRLPEDASERAKDMEDYNKTDDTYVHVCDADRYAVMEYTLEQSLPRHAARSRSDAQVGHAQRIHAALARENQEWRRTRGI